MSAIAPATADPAPREARTDSPTPLIEMGIRSWDAGLAPEEQATAVATTESGGVLFFPRLDFALEAHEHRFLSSRWSDGKAKNISLDLSTGRLSGAQATADDIAALSGMIARFAG